MTAQVIPVRTTGSVQTGWTDSTAVVHQVLMEHNVKQVTVVHNSSALLGPRYYNRHMAFR